MEKLYEIYKICIQIAIAIPLVSLIFGSLIDDFDFDLDLDTEFHFSSMLPMSPLSFSSFMLGLGASGLILIKITPNASLFLALLIGFLCSFIFNYFIMRPLKKIKNNSFESKDLVGKKGVVVDRIKKDSIGNVSFNIPSGKITYLAKSNQDIQQGETVEVISFDGTTVDVIKSKEEEGEINL